MKNKRGQFFILATLIIATIVVSFTLGMNKVNSRGTQDDFPVFAEEFDYEFSKMIDLKVATGEDNLTDFINDSAAYMTFVYPETGMVVYYIDEGYLKMENRLNSTGSCLNNSDGVTCVSAGGTDSISDPLGEINLSVGDTVFLYDSLKGSKSYIVFMREINDEVYIYVKE